VRLAVDLAVLDLGLVAGGAAAVRRLVGLAVAGGGAVLDLDLALEADRAIGVGGARGLDDRAAGGAELVDTGGERDRGEEQGDAGGVLEHGGLLSFVRARPWWPVRASMSTDPPRPRRVSLAVERLATVTRFNIFLLLSYI
jgi:hypothetical protein